MPPAKTDTRDARTARNLDPAHVMDFSNLHLGHPKTSKTVVTIVDMDVFVYGLDEIKDSTRPLAVACLSHGWANKALHMEQMAYGVIGEARRLEKEGGRKVVRDMIVVTLVRATQAGAARRPGPPSVLTPGPPEPRGAAAEPERAGVRQQPGEAVRLLVWVQQLTAGHRLMPRLVRSWSDGADPSRRRARLRARHGQPCVLPLAAGRASHRRVDVLGRLAGR